MRSTRTLIAPFVALALLAASCTSSNGSTASTASAPSIEERGGTYRVTIDPAGFVDVIDNPYFPLIPGSKWRLEGETDEGKEVDTITVTEDTKEVMGVTTTVVEDIVTINGEVAEKTLDWYAQDVDGNVWYFGEDTAEYANGKKLNTSGSWEAGVDVALPGVIVHSDPQVNDAFRQEYYKGEAEDMYWVVETNINKSVPFGDFDSVVHALEWSPVEPNVVGEKFYAPGIGLIWERSLAGGHEIFRLVEFHRP